MLRPGGRLQRLPAQIPTGQVLAAALQELHVSAGMNFCYECQPNISKSCHRHRRYCRPIFLQIIEARASSVRVAEGRSTCTMDAENPKPPRRAREVLRLSERNRDLLQRLLTKGLPRSVAKKIQAILLMDLGLRNSRISERLQVTQSTVSRWGREYRLQGMSAIDPETAKDSNQPAPEAGEPTPRMPPDD